MATDASDREQQQRELEEIRRQFAEVGERISAFEPAAADDDRERPLALAPTTAPADEQPASPAHRQRRELKEIRHKFIEVGQRLDSAVESTLPPRKDRWANSVLSPMAPLADPTRPRRLLVAAVALILLVGIGLGYALPRSGTSEPPAAPAATLAPQPTPRIKVVAPSACLETAKRGDEVFALLSSNVRVNDRRLAEAMKAYTLASQACRKEASP